MEFFIRNQVTASSDCTAILKDAAHLKHAESRSLLAWISSQYSQFHSNKSGVMHVGNGDEDLDPENSLRQKAVALKNRWDESPRMSAIEDEGASK